MRRRTPSSAPGARHRKGRAGLVELVAALAITALVGGLFWMAQASEGTPRRVEAEAAPPTTTVAVPHTIVGGGVLTRKDDKLRRARSLARDVTRATSLLPTVIRVGSFNILGSQHTGRGGDKGPGWPGAAARLPGAIERIKAHQVSLVGLQEVQPDQLAGLLRGTGFDVYPGPEVGSLNRVNSIIYDPEVYDFVSGDTFSMSNGSGVRAQPIVRLRVKETGQEVIFVNTHPPAGHTRGIVAKRMGTLGTIASVVNGLKSEGLPIFLTGDMNDRQAFARRVLPATGMVSSYRTGPMPVDWLVATPNVLFTDYVRDTTTIRRRISDHFFIAATATIAPTS